MSGFRCGGLQAISAAKARRVTAVVLQHPGILHDGPRTIPGRDLRKDALLDLPTPVLCIRGDPTDIAQNNSLDDWQRLAHAPFAIETLQGAALGGRRRWGLLLHRCGWRSYRRDADALRHRLPRGGLGTAPGAGTEGAHRPPLRGATGRWLRA